MATCCGRASEAIHKREPMCVQRAERRSGLKTAQWFLGTMYQTGYGVQQDYVQAHMWYNLSAAQGWGAAAENRTMLERAMTPAQVAEAQKLAREWKPKPER
jgi:uncharacterized protein